MEFSAQQESAITKVNSWLKTKHSPVFTLAGYAGTGKTTLARHLADSVSGEVFFAAYTGKAAFRLMALGVESACTIHSLIYLPKGSNRKRLDAMLKELMEMEAMDPVPLKLREKLLEDIREEEKDADRPIFKLNPDSPLHRASLVVVDEFSMIGEQMGDDLLSYNVPILALGDPAQLSPVKSKSWFPRTHKYDVMLTDIHRQAKDNPIIRIASDVRQGKWLEPGDYGDVVIDSAHRLGKEGIRQHALQSDQILVGKHTTRKACNQRLRELHERDSDLPQKGDRLVCTKNDSNRGLLNGQLWQCESDSQMRSDGKLDLHISCEDDGEETFLEAHQAPFHGQEIPFYEVKGAACFDYGYALTVHKAQGSQWDNVTLMDEWHGNGRKEWLYTGITRAAKKLTIVQM